MPETLYSINLDLLIRILILTLVLGKDKETLFPMFVPGVSPLKVLEAPELEVFPLS